MKKNSAKAMAKPDKTDAVAKSGKPNPPRELSSPPCYAHEFPGYFGEIEEGNPEQQTPKKENG